jgi:hypothetical protein
LVRSRHLHRFYGSVGATTRCASGNVWHLAGGRPTHASTQGGGCMRPTGFHSPATAPPPHAALPASRSLMR